MQGAEAVVIRMYEYADGDLQGRVVFIGDAAEARDFADTPRLLLGMPGRKAISDDFVLVADLAPPTEESQ